MQWTQLAGGLIALAFYIVPLALVIGAALLARRFYERKDRRNPLSRDLLREPGHTVKKQLDRARDDLIAYVAALVPMPLFFLASWAVQGRIDARRPPFPAIYFLVFAAAAAFIILRTFALTKEIRNASLGYEAEAAVGQELNQLLRLGFHVFHDVSGDKAFNIDHVVVGPTGVFAVETKGRSKPLDKGKPAYKVELRDEKLIFPGWTEVEPLLQSVRNAEWLSKWLSSATGERVDVHPALALPGWYVERRDKSNVFVFNATNSAATLGKYRPSSFSDEQVARIVHQLDAKCRDVRPTAR